MIMPSYQCFGLGIHSKLTIPELVEIDCNKDVTISEKILVLPKSASFSEGRYFTSTPNEAFLAWRSFIYVNVTGGYEISYWPLKDMPDYWIRQYILGPALGVLLHQRRIITLHGSAIADQNNAYAILGWKGQGKSTTAASLYHRGYSVLTDDIVAIDMCDEENPMVMPGFFQLKLWPDAVKFLGLKESELKMIQPDSDKRAHLLSIKQNSPLPLKGIYVLDKGEKHEIVPISKKEAFSEIVKNSYAARFMGIQGISGWHFGKVVSLSKNTMVYRFKRKSGLDKLPEALNLMEISFSD